MMFMVLLNFASFVSLHNSSASNSFVIPINKGALPVRSVQLLFAAVVKGAVEASVITKVGQEGRLGDFTGNGG